MWFPRLSSISLLAFAWSVLGSAGCLGTRSIADPDTSDSTAGSETSVSITITSAVSTAASSTSISTTGESVDDTRGSTSVLFLLEPDVPGHTYECDLFMQDCPPGEKCTVWADDGGDMVNATKCVPVVDDPIGTDEPCHAQGTPYSGVDDCDLGEYCLDVDPKTLEGICVPFCVGDEANPTCEDPSRECQICGDWCLPVCLGQCSPLEQDCPPGQACYPVQEEWTCAPDASGETGGYGDPCEFINVCDPGLICLDSSVAPPGLPCEGAAGCCTEVCDLSDPAGDLQCMGAAGGQTCQSWYAEGTAPAGYENVGACALPA